MPGGFLAPASCLSTPATIRKSLPATSSLALHCKLTEAVSVLEKDGALLLCTCAKPCFKRASFLLAEWFKSKMKIPSWNHTHAKLAGSDHRCRLTKMQRQGACCTHLTAGTSLFFQRADVIAETSAHINLNSTESHLWYH